MPIACFAELRAILEELDIPILPPDSPYVGPGETRLLGWLAWFQRWMDGDELSGQQGLHAALRRCADHLRQANLRLEIRNFLSAGAFVDADGRRIAIDLPALPARRSMRERILQFVAKQGTVSSSDLQRFGASRQTISAMHKEGQLRRIGWSRYTLPKKD
ncbi:MAG: type IV toxin-antitoxin system AbiEi family antitoxin domain-containing protein [Sphingobium sp.]